MPQDPQPSEIDRLYSEFTGQQPAPQPAAPPVAKPASTPRQPGPTRDQQIADIEYQMRQRDMQEGAIGETRARLSSLSNSGLRKEHARLTKIFSTVPETRPARLEEERRREAYYAQPLYKRIGQEADVALAGVGESINRAASRVAQPVMRAVGLGEYADRWNQASAEKSQILAEQQAEQERIANRLPSKIRRGVIGGGAQALTMAPVAMATGPAGVTAMTALESDVERDPGGALAQTIAAPVAMAAGRAISPAAGRAASAFTSKPVQKAVQVGIEGLAGGAANVGQYAATSKALGRPITSDDLIEQGITGAGLASAMSPKLARTAAAEGVTRPSGPRPLNQAESSEAGIARALSDYGRTVEEINKSNTYHTVKQMQLEQARQNYLAERKAATNPPALSVEAPQLGGQASAATVQGPRVGEDLALTAAGTQAPESPSLGRAVGNTFRVGSQAIRTFKTAYDLSAPLSQGFFLSRAHPLKGIRSFGRMLQSLSPKQSARVDEDILNNPYKAIGDQFDLHIATGGAPEEMYMLGALNKVPGIGASERTYRTFLDSLRLSVWEGYVKSLQAGGHTPESNPTAYRQAAQFINIATGRGSLKAGGKIDRAMALGGDILFAPRNLIAKFQLLDPVRYATLAPGARRLVLRDAVTSYGTILATAAMLRAAGVRVGLNPLDDDFLEARWGRHRYDLTGGLKTEVKFLAKMARGVYNQASGEGNLPNQDPLSVASSYFRNKLAPGPGLAYDALSGRDFKGQKFSDKSYTDIGMEAIAPMFVEDLYEGFKDSGLQGMAKSAPAFLGQRVSVYGDRAKAQWLNEPQSWRSEQRRDGQPRMFLGPKKADKNVPGSKDETPAEFSARLFRVNGLLKDYGAELVNSAAYQFATDEERRDARAYLRKLIGRDHVNERLLNPRAIISTVRSSRKEKERARR